MSARGHRDEIVALVAIVVLTALVLGAVALFNGGDGGGSDTTVTAPSPAASTEPPPSPSPTPVASTLRIGTAPFVYACRLVPREEVQRIFGDLGAEARTRQTYLTRRPVDGESTAPAATTGGGLTTSCDYTIGDPAGHTLEIEVSQFPTERGLARRWAALGEQGVPVKRTDAMLSLPARRSFVLLTDPAIVEVRYSTFGDLARKRPMSARERAWQERRMRAVQRVVSDHLADGTAVDSPAPVTAGAPGGGATPYLSPCNLLTDAVFQAAGGPRPGPVDVDSSYLPRDPYADAPVASCERRGTAGGRTTFEVLEVRVAATPAEAREVEAKHLDNRYPKRAKVRKVSTSAGKAYVADLGGSPTWPWRSRSIQFVVGPYELHLSVLTGVTKAKPYGEWVGPGRLVAAADALIEDLSAVGVDPVP